MRDYGPVRMMFIPSIDQSDEDVALTYAGEARKQLGILKNLMSFNKLQQLSRRIVLADGAEIFVQSVMGQDRIQVTPPSAGVAPEEIPTSTVVELSSSIIVGSSGSGYGDVYATMWKNSTPSLLPVPTGNTGIAYSISEDLSTIVGKIGIYAGKWDQKSLAYTQVTSMPVPSWGGTDNSGYATCQSQYGDIIIGYTPDDVNSLGFIWENGSVAPLPEIFPNNLYRSRPLGCSYDASVIVGYRQDRFSVLTPGSVLPLIWQQDPTSGLYSVSILPLPVGMTNGLASSCSADGSVIIGSAYYVSPTNILGLNHNVVWINGEVNDLGVGAGGQDVSKAGDVLLAWTSNGHSAMIRKDSAGNFNQYTDLGNPPISPPGSSLSAYAISADGTTAVGGTGYSAFVWKGAYKLLDPAITGYIGNAYDIGILDPDPSLETTLPGASVPA